MDKRKPSFSYKSPYSWKISLNHPVSLTEFKLLLNANLSDTRTDFKDYLLRCQCVCTDNSICCLNVFAVQCCTPRSGFHLVLARSLPGFLCKRDLKRLSLS